MAHWGICMNRESRNGPATIARSGLMLAILETEATVSLNRRHRIHLYIFTGLTAGASDTTFAYHDSRPHTFTQDRSYAEHVCGRIGAHSRFRCIFTCQPGAPAAFQGLRLNKCARPALSHARNFDSFTPPHGINVC